jgi:hypothetical protein
MAGDSEMAQVPGKLTKLHSAAAKSVEGFDQHQDARRTVRLVCLHGGSLHSVLPTASTRLRSHQAQGHGVRRNLP